MSLRPSSQAQVYRCLKIDLSSISSRDVGVQLGRQVLRQEACRLKHLLRENWDQRNLHCMHNVTMKQDQGS